MRMTAEAWRDVLETNLFGAFYTTKAVTRPMLKARGGRIINITSVSGQAGQTGQANYSSAKAGLIGLTKATARELASRGITVNAVAPGFVLTELTQDLPEALQAEITERTPLGRFGTTEEIADAVAFLASDEAALHHGPGPRRRRRPGDDVIRGRSRTDRYLRVMCGGVRDTRPYARVSVTPRSGVPRCPSPILASLAPRRLATPSVRLVAGLTAILVLATACGSPPSPSPSAVTVAQATDLPVPVATPAPTATPAPDRDPDRDPDRAAADADLTGLDVDPERAHRLPLAVMLDDARRARPQSGFNGASVIYQATADGYETRYLLIFGEGDSREVGPVRSARFLPRPVGERARCGLCPLRRRPAHADLHRRWRRSR